MSAPLTTQASSGNPEEAFLVYRNEARTGVRCSSPATNALTSHEAVLAVAVVRRSARTGVRVRRGSGPDRRNLR
jgi:hypothetical protein